MRAENSYHLKETPVIQSAFLSEMWCFKKFFPS